MLRESVKAASLDQGRGSTGATWGRSCGNLRLGAQYLPRSTVNLAVHSNLQYMPMHHHFDNMIYLHYKYDPVTHTVSRRDFGNAKWKETKKCVENEKRDEKHSEGKKKKNLGWLHHLQQEREQKH